MLLSVYTRETVAHCKPFGSDKEGFLSISGLLVDLEFATLVASRGILEIVFFLLGFFFCHICGMWDLSSLTRNRTHILCRREDS